MTSLTRFVRHHLDDGTRDLLGKEIAERVAIADLDSDAHQAILARIGRHALSRHLPGEILHTLQVFSATGHHALLLENLPCQRFPDTPVSGFAAETELAIANTIHFGLIHLLGLTPFAVEHENEGRLIRNVVPNPSVSGSTRSWGADADFFWHTDNPNLPFGEPGSDPRPYIPRYLTFYGVRNQERVPTELTAVDEVIGQLDRAILGRLHSPSFDVGPPASNDMAAAGSSVLLGVAVLESGANGWQVRYDGGTTTGRTAEATAALETWSHALPETPKREVVLKPGEFLIFDNYRVLHSRRRFAPDPQDEARWLRRCYAS